MLTIGDSNEGMLANRIFMKLLELICALDDVLQGAPRDAESGSAGRDADRRFTREQLGGLRGVRDETAEALPLILEVQRDAWWEDVTVPMLEHLRRGLRPLASHMERWEPPPIQSCIVWGKGTGDDDQSEYVPIPHLLRR